MYVTGIGATASIGDPRAGRVGRRDRQAVVGRGTPARRGGPRILCEPLGEIQVTRAELLAALLAEYVDHRDADKLSPSASCSGAIAPEA
jgi:hypothetical protein